jgi:UDP-glucose 4-epimerase
MRYFVTGGAGFIGSNMVDRLMATPDNSVTVYDNLSSGRREFLAQHQNDNRFKFIEADLLDLDRLTESIIGHDMVIHFAANADVRTGVDITDIDLENGVRAT